MTVKSVLDVRTIVPRERRGTLMPAVRRPATAPAAGARP